VIEPVAGYRAGTSLPRVHPSARLTVLAEKGLVIALAKVQGGERAAISQNSTESITAQARSRCSRLITSRHR